VSFEKRVFLRRQCWELEENIDFWELTSPMCLLPKKPEKNMKLVSFAQEEDAVSVAKQTNTKYGLFV